MRSGTLLTIMENLIVLTLQNEYWLETEAQLRTDFNIPGLKNDAIARVKAQIIDEEYLY